MGETEFVGNVLCLDFANTVNKRPNPHRDALDSAEALSQWAAAAAVRSAGEPRREAPPPASSAELSQARRLREAIYRVFSAVASGGEPRPADVAIIMTTYASALTAAQLRHDGPHFSLFWPPPVTVRRITWMITASAAQLLLNGPLDRVGECPSCHWLFLDTSRGGRRRWCSMAVCGARSKARRYYATTASDSTTGGRPTGFTSLT